ncbi:hypothetical protein SHIRM173S_11066 [Streptomyces hirsutus]
MESGDHNDLRPEFVREVGGWIASGELVSAEATVVEGIEVDDLQRQVVGASGGTGCGGHASRVPTCLTS